MFHVMNYKAFLKKYGGDVAKIRERFGIYKQRMNNWRVADWVPYGALYEIEQLEKKEKKAA